MVMDSKEHRLSIMANFLCHVPPLVITEQEVDFLHLSQVFVFNVYFGTLFYSNTHDLQWKLCFVLVGSLSHQCLLNWHIFIPVQQLMVGLSPPVKWSLAADFNQVSSIGHRAKFPDNIACCGNRNLKVAGDTNVALRVHTCLHLTSDTWFSLFALTV